MQFQYPADRLVTETRVGLLAKISFKNGQQAGRVAVNIHIARCGT